MSTDAKDYFSERFEIGNRLIDLTEDQSQWSQATFGKDSERGPIGAIKHLQKEAAEVLEAWEKGDKGAFTEECADCLLLLLDLTRRGGVKPMQLIEAAQLKMVINKSRIWPKTVGDVPTEHNRGEQ